MQNLLQMETGLFEIHHRLKASASVCKTILKRQYLQRIVSKFANQLLAAAGSPFMKQLNSVFSSKTVSRLKHLVKHVSVVKGGAQR